MFERFTDRARRVVVLAQEEARHLNHNYIGTEHILLGLIAENQGVAARVLRKLGAVLPAMRQQVLDIVGQGNTPPRGHIPFTPRAKRVFELTLRQALQLGHNYIGTEHIMLGLIREREGVAAQMLERAGITLERARESVLAELGVTEHRRAAGGEVVAEVAAGPPTSGPVPAPSCPRCGGDLGVTAASTVIEVPEDGGDGKRRVMFLYCNACGIALDQFLLPGSP